MQLIKAIYDFFVELAHGMYHDSIDTKPEELAMNQEPIVIPPDLKGHFPSEPYLYLWSTPQLARHSVRVIADEEGLTVEQKNTMCATIGGESGWDVDAVNKNYVNGKVTSVDYGLCQWNNYYHGKEITPGEAIGNPEKAVRLMCAYWKRGQRNLWVAYSSGRYKLYL